MMAKKADDTGATDWTTSLSGGVDEWLAFLATATTEIGALLAVPVEEQDRLGYGHTLREICQQPATWLETASRTAGNHEVLERALAEVKDGAGSILLTGSGSSLYIGECLSVALQDSLGVSVQAVAAGMVLTHPSGCLPARGPCLIISFARSGNSPESCGLLDSVLEVAPACRHLLITCNGHGLLATSYREDPRVSLVVLDDRTHDRSLVMTSSFTNMVLAGRLLGLTHDLPGYKARSASLARRGADLLLRFGDSLARVARTGFDSAVYLGSGVRFGSSRESALKMLEMTAGKVKTFPETYLGLRHGPMCAVDDGALVVCFLASDPVTRAYESDLIRELNRKNLGARKVIVGQAVPGDLALADDLVVDTDGLDPVSDEDAPVLDAVVGQILAFFRCRSIGLRPDQPSDDGVISRVVEGFVIHRRS